MIGSSPFYNDECEEVVTSKRKTPLPLFPFYNLISLKPTPLKKQQQQQQQHHQQAVPSFSEVYGGGGGCGGDGGHATAAKVGSKRGRSKRGVDCEFEGCSKRARSGFRFCVAHGGGKRCSVEGCTNGVQSRGLCIKHGGGKRCQTTGCDNSAKIPSKYCMSCQGGGERCMTPGCKMIEKVGGLCESCHRQERRKMKKQEKKTASSSSPLAFRARMKAKKERRKQEREARAQERGFTVNGSRFELVKGSLLELEEASLPESMPLSKCLKRMFKRVVEVKKGHDDDDDDNDNEKKKKKKKKKKKDRIYVENVSFEWQEDGEIVGPKLFTRLSELGQQKQGGNKGGPLPIWKMVKKDERGQFIEFMDPYRRYRFTDPAEPPRVPLPEATMRLRGGRAAA